MDPSSPPPVRFRLVLEMSFPDADPWDPTDYGSFLAGVKSAIEHAANLSCTDVVLREAMTIGPADNYEDWRGGHKVDFSSFASGTGYVWGIRYPVDQVDPDDLAKVWRVLAEAESNKLGSANVAVAVGKQLRPDSNAEAIIARVFVLRVLQAHGEVPKESARRLFETAATFPLQSRPENEAEIAALAHFFQ